MLLIFFSFLCCPIMCLSVLSSVLWCPLRFPYKNYVRIVFSSSCLLEYACLIYVFCVCLRMALSNTHCVVWLLCLSSCCKFLWIVLFYCPFRILWPLFWSCVLCNRCCQFLWMVLFWLPLRYSLAFMLSVLVISWYKLWQLCPSIPVYSNNKNVTII